MVSQDREYQPVADICERIFGYRPSPVVVTRWHKTGRDGKLLRVAKVANRILSKDAYVIEFFENSDAIAQIEKSESRQPKTRSEAARKKASDEANKQLDSMGI